MRFVSSPFLAFFAICVAASPVVAASVPGDAYDPLPMGRGHDALTAALSSDDDFVFQEGLAKIQSMAASNLKPIRDNLESKWLKPLLQHGCYDEIQNLSMTVIMDSPRLSEPTSNMQECRVRAFLAAHDYKHALPAAKAFYNVCALDKTPVAIELLAEALAASPSNDPNIVTRFRLQQAEGANIPADITKPLVLPTSLGKNVLQSIAVDATVYNQRIESYRHMLPNFWSHAGHGNLLLLADRPAEAEKEFQQALTLAPAEQMGLAIQNVARAIRAEDGLVGRANAYILDARSIAQPPQ